MALMENLSCVFLLIIRGSNPRAHVRSLMIFRGGNSRALKVGMSIIMFLCRASN